MSSKAARAIPAGIAAALAVAGFAQTQPAGCAGSVSLGSYRIEAQRPWGGDLLPLKSVSSLQAGSRIVWEPAHPPQKPGLAEVTAIVVPLSGDDVTVLDPHKADARAEWQLAASPAAIAIVYGPQGLSMS
ncbi:MAG TPA: hypothetical protein VMU19_01650, partial [Bryobacteraceae bacterium]|nr:hypothetical protein [Bryobacteraceae bacterium]